MTPRFMTAGASWQGKGERAPEGVGRPLCQPGLALPSGASLWNTRGGISWIHDVSSALSPASWLVWPA